MTCDRFLVLLDELDNEEMPPEMAAHMRSCTDCARSAAALQAAISLYRLPDMAGSSDVAPRVVSLLPFMPAPRRTVSMRDWLIVGLVILSSIIILPLMSDFGQLKAAYGSEFTFPVSLILGALVTLYAGLFVISHLDEFAKRLKEREAHQHGRTA